MIREAKGVAIHDLSFWDTTLPFLSRLPRVIKRLQVPLGPGFWMRLTPDQGAALHDETLAAFHDIMIGQATGEGSDGALEMASALASFMSGREVEGDPEIDVAVPGCGVVTGGSCDILWKPYVVELKLTAKDPALRDVRQVLVYAALLRISGLESPRAGLVANPRRGLAVEFDIEELLLMTGGVSANDFSNALSDFLVSAGTSN